MHSDKIVQVIGMDTCFVMINKIVNPFSILEHWCNLNKIRALIIIAKTMRIYMVNQIKNLWQNLCIYIVDKFSPCHYYIFTFMFINIDAFLYS